MPKVREFVEKGRDSLQDPSPDENHENEAIPKLLKGYGLSHHSGVNSKLSELHKARPMSRQEVGNRSRVPAPATILPVSDTGLHIQAQQPRAPHQVTLVTRTASDDRQDALLRGHAGNKSADMFDTDTEQLDNTSFVSDPVNNEHPPVKFKEEVEPDARGRQERGSTESHTSRAPRKIRNRIKNRGTASYKSEAYAETSADHDGDDEYDASLQAEHFQRGTRGPSHQRRETSFDASSGKGHPNVVASLHTQQYVHEVDQLSHPPNVSPTFAGPDLPGHSRQPSDGDRSSDGSSSEADNAGLRQFPGIDEGSMLIHELNTGLDGRIQLANSNAKGSHQVAMTDKRSFSPKWEYQGPVDSEKQPIASVRDASNGINGHDRPTSQKRPFSHSKADEGLDYDMKTLAEMSYRQLAEESFDASPQATHLKDAGPKDESLLKEKLFHMRSLNGPKEQVRSQRQAFFSSLSINQYDECGELMAQQLSQIMLKFQQARREKRRVAAEFEKEVGAREQVVESRKVAVMTDLDRLKRTGQEVVGRK
ncbi:MAG: hypothetical protein LQ348_006982 [Seirophora lacunosa]|nr:MAG: hypothetical protein LQ348_006982 [Seirophora lacunosa]